MYTRTALVALVSGLSLLSATAQEARFFRIAGPVPTTITEVTPDGWVTWTNDPTNATFTVQTTTGLPEESNWVDWMQVPVSNAVTAHRVFDPNPPEGMAFIPAGTFLMGATTNMGHESYPDETPQHSVFVSGFHMDRTEVTWALWQQVQAYANANGFDLAAAGLAKETNHPVRMLTWCDAIKWCNARTQMEGLTPCYYTDLEQTTLYKTGQLDLSQQTVKWTASGYRLPTEAEWEKAARGGTPGHRFPWSDSETIQHSRANYSSSASWTYDTSPTRGYHPVFNDGIVPYTNPVGVFPPNGYGVYDMSGNLEEWCWDVFDPTWYSSPNAVQTDTRGPQSFSNRYGRVGRGGSWNITAPVCRTAARGGNLLTYGLYGFRCVRAAGQ